MLFADIGPKRVFQINNKSINNSVKIAKYEPNIDPKSTGNSCKVNQMSSKVNSNRFGKKVCSRTPKCRNLMLFLVVLAPLGRFWEPLRPNWIPKGSRNRYFGSSSEKKAEKKVSKTRPQKTWAFNRKLLPKWMASEVKVCVWQTTCCKVQSSVCHEIFRKWMPKCIPTIIKFGIRNQKRSEIIFLRFSNEIGVRTF